jgi:endoglucanase
MRRSRVILSASTLSLLVLILLAFFGSCPLVRASGTVTVAPQVNRFSPVTSFRSKGLDGPYHTQGNRLIGADNKPYLVHGIGRSGLEFACFGDGHFSAQELSYMGTGKNTSTVTYWQANTVRLPLSEYFWLNGDPANHCSTTQYQQLVKNSVAALITSQLNVILDLHHVDAGGQITGQGENLAMPDADSVTFWKQVAAAFKGYNNVLFELYNEPHPPSWACWQQGCALSNDSGHSYQSVGMQSLVNAVRGTGASNILILGGVRWGFDLSQIAQFPIAGKDLVYSSHPYPYGDKMPNTWDQAFGTISASYPVISTESGQYDCKTNYISQLLPYFDAHHIGWVSWAWISVGQLCEYPQLVTNYNGVPAPALGQYIYQRLHSYTT